MADTGPPIPHPVAGQNAIGQFQIGVSPIGDISPFDIWRTVLSQYGNSPILTQMILDFTACVDQTQNFQSFYDSLWNVETAEGYGLDVWGRIVGVNRVIPVAISNDFGFAEGSYSGFGQYELYSGTLSTQNVPLTDDAYRRLIFAKAMANITSGNTPSLNQILLTMFPNRGNCFVIDNGSLSITLGFTFALSALDQAILNTGVFPRPSGTSLNIIQNIASGVTWDIAMGHGSLTTFGQGNLQAIIALNNGTGIQGARSNWFHSTGNSYTELTVLRRDNPNVIRLGVGGTGAIKYTTTGTIGGFNLGDAASGTSGSIAYNFANGSVLIGGVSQASLASGTLGTGVGIAINLTADLIWFRTVGGSGAVGFWNGSASANPALNQGGISISSLAMPIYIRCGVQEVGTTVIQANFGQLPFYGTAPVGYGNS